MAALPPLTTLVSGYKEKGHCQHHTISFFTKTRDLSEATMFLSPYKTTPCKDYILKDIVSELLLGKVEGMLMDQGNGVWLVTPALNTVPIFTQPITRIEMNNRQDVPPVIVDGRALLRQNREGGWLVANHTELQFQNLRGQLQILWMQEGFDKLDLLRIGDLPATVFTNWVSKSLSSKLGLDPQQYLNTSVVVAFYYACLHYDEAHFGEDDKLRIASQIARWTRIPVPSVLSIVDQLSYLENIKALVEALKQYSGSARMEQLSAGLVYALLGGSWFNNRETVSVALEHPPTFVAFVKAAIELRSYKNTVLAKVTQLAIKGGNDKEFIKNLNFLLGNR